MEAAWKCVDQGGFGAVGHNECGEPNFLRGVGWELAFSAENCMWKR